MEYKRMPLTVDVTFDKNGVIRPKRIVFLEESFDITKVLSVRRYCPTQVSCIAPIEYTIIVENHERKIYYEPDTQKWFSVKQTA